MTDAFKLRRGVLLAMVGGMCLSASLWAAPGEPWEPTGSQTPKNMKARTTAINRPKVAGSYYEATVPDTLDLAERAGWGINHFTSVTCEEQDYEMYWRGDLDNTYWPGCLSFQNSPLMACQAKAAEAMAMERLMSGSQQDLELEAKMLEMLASHIGDDGIYYVMPSGGQKPWLGAEDMRPFANVHGQARMMRAMMAWYQYTGNPKWKALVDRMVDGLDRLMVVHKDDYAYFPTHGWMPEEYFRSCYVKGRGWKDTAEPEDEKGGEEGSLFNHQGHTAGVLANWYMLTGNTQALRLSGELVRFLIKPQFWADNPGGEYPGVVGADHAHWQGHWHGYLNTLRAILEYAIAANDSRLKQFVRDGYEWTRQAGLARIGYMGDGQGCGCGRLIGLAVKLSDAGVGDYWEDVDLYIRNHGTETQFTPEEVPEFKRRIAELPKQPPPDSSVPGEGKLHGTDVGTVEASVGAFANDPGRSLWVMCCSPHGNMGLFYAWDGTLRYSGGIARVNLLLNRASPWMDIDSYLPYEGKVVLRNKKAHEAFVRMPLWVDLGAVKCRVGKRAVQPKWFGRYLRIEGLKPGDTVAIEFPVVERVEKWTAPPTGYFTLPLPQGTVYDIKFRGNTVVAVTPPMSRFYVSRPEKYRAAKASMKKVTRYVTGQQLRW